MNLQWLGKTQRATLALCSALIMLGCSALPMVQAVQAQSLPKFVPGEVLIKLKPDVQTASVQAMFSRAQAKPLEQLGHTAWIRVRVPSNQAMQQVIAQLRQMPEVEYAEPNYIVQAIGIPNDTDFGRLWGLHQSNDVDIDAPEAWDNFQPAGNRVVVGVIDTGVDYTHPDLYTRIWTNPKEIAGNGVDDDHNGYIDDTRGWDFLNNDNDPMDDNNHGTHVSGTIAAAFNNARGIAGVAGPADVRIMPLKFLGSNGSGPTSAAIKALDYATVNGAVITNNSWGGGSFSQALYDALVRNHQAGRLFMAAAGNNSSNTDGTLYYPQGYNVPNILSVASTTSSDTLSSFSNYGASSVDLGAPGSTIYSTVRGGGYATYNGTSMATPHVAGAAALVWAKNHTLTNLQVKDILLKSTRKVGYLGGKTVSGGVLNLQGAMAMTALPGSPAPPPPTEPAPGPAPEPSPGPIPLPTAPTNLVGEPILEKRTHYSIRYAKLTWKDNANNELGYEIHMGTSATGSFTRIKVVGTNITTWTDQITRQPMSTDVYYKVRAYNMNGVSAFSNTVRIPKF